MQITETLPNGTDKNDKEEEKAEKNEELPETEEDAVISDNYPMPYFSPFIYVPPIPFVPLGNYDFIMYNKTMCLKCMTRTKEEMMCIV